MHLPHSSTLGPERLGASDPPRCDFRILHTSELGCEYRWCGGRWGLNSGGDASGLEMHQGQGVRVVFKSSAARQHVLHRIQLAHHVRPHTILLQPHEHLCGARAAHAIQHDAAEARSD
eukprot:2614921-Prymnesium_polylepis.1